MKQYNQISESDEFDEEVIYSQESPKREASVKDFETGIWIGLLSTDRLSQEKETLPIKKPLYILGLELKSYLI